MNEIASGNVEKYLCRYYKILSNMSYDMGTANLGCNITLNFIRCMIPHHQAAIYMCQNLLEYTQNSQLIEIANNIIQMQTSGIKEMKEIMDTTKCKCNCIDDAKNYINKYIKITQNMIFNMKNAQNCNDVNLNFVNEMIPHHEGAICMCENLLNYKIDYRLKEVAENIIKEQSEGVLELREVHEAICKLKNKEGVLN